MPNIMPNVLIFGMPNVLWGEDNVHLIAHIRVREDELLSMAS